MVQSDGMERNTEHVERRDPALRIERGGGRMRALRGMTECVFRASSADSHRWCKVNLIAVFAEGAISGHFGRGRGAGFRPEVCYQF